MEESLNYFYSTVGMILEKCKELAICQKRAMEDDYYELVLLTKEIRKWDEVCGEVLGPARKPKGVQPTLTDIELTRQYGGIFDNQTLFKSDSGNESVIAMFWPWQDGMHVTLKIAHLKW